MIIDGRKIADKLLIKIKNKADSLMDKPGLAVILVGNDKASAIYVNNKEKACLKVGFYSKKIILAQNITESELLVTIKTLNNDNKIHGILVQLPLPVHINSDKIIEAISARKDVDGFCSQNIGKLLQNKAKLRPATPKGVMIILNNINANLVGANAVVVGASNIVGRPMAIELLNAGATVTICHSKTKNLVDKINSADILVVAIGKAEFIKGNWIKKGAIVIDVGINRNNDNKLIGDVEFDKAKDIASFITPVPGGVGPLTIASLLENTLLAYGVKL